MSVPVRTVLERQFATGRRLLAHHLDGLGDAECLWRPTPTGPHVAADAGGRWRAEWPEREDYAAGAPSIAWLTWHAIYWWTTVLDRSFGDGKIERADIPWPGSAGAAVRRIEELADQWSARLAALSEAELASPQRTRWPFAERPFADVAAWVTVELTKTAAEIGLLRFLYAARADA